MIIVRFSDLSPVIIYLSRDSKAVPFYESDSIGVGIYQTNVSVIRHNYSYIFTNILLYGIEDSIIHHDYD